MDEIAWLLGAGFVLFVLGAIIGAGIAKRAAKPAKRTPVVVSFNGEMKATPATGPQVELIELGSGEWQARVHVPRWGGLGREQYKSTYTHADVYRDNVPRRFPTRGEALAAGRSAVAKWEAAQVVRRETVPVSSDVEPERPTGGPDPDE